MKNRYVVSSIKFLLQVVYVFFSHHKGTLCNHIFTVRRILKTGSKDDKLFIKSFRIYRVSRYGSGITMAYVEHNNKWKTEIIGRVSSCDLVLYVFFDHTKTKVTVFYHYPKQKRFFLHLRHYS